MTKAYARSFVPTPMASVAMGDAADVSESTWADEQPSLTPIKFILLLPEEAALGWWQYLHWRFPLAVGWGAGSPPAPAPLYVDPTRWLPNYLKASENLFSLVVATPQTMDWARLDVQGVLVLVGVEGVPGLDKAFSVVVQRDGCTVAVGYLGAPVSLEDARPTRTEAPQVVPAFLPASYWQTLV
jgi:hypothetical protein